MDMICLCEFVVHLGLRTNYRRGQSDRFALVFFDEHFYVSSFAAHPPFVYRRRGCLASRCRPIRHLPFRLCRRLSTKDFCIGYRKAANTPVLLKLHGTLEKRLALLARNRQVDRVSCRTAVARRTERGRHRLRLCRRGAGGVCAGSPNFVYTAYEIPTPRAEGILVHRETPIKTQADPKDRNLRLTKVPMFTGYSSQHYRRAA
ncbi:hypothetical protein SAMN05192548_101653 [Paraburkholderia terricola]|uniref:Uncharacterized protein n=1 Tax=Paraburkholderia terricola TaxID=169427 RepID=A0A1M6QNX3_9BURK|nr:hypothetical protein SAMN05192547_1015102 [Paraburkholderia sediminicola]SHK21961.1 hypothetical protein SAMN05192548_101653 [Paraburkholderia terricola]